MGQIVYIWPKMITAVYNWRLTHENGEAVGFAKTPMEP